MPETPRPFSAGSGFESLMAHKSRGPGTGVVPGLRCFWGCSRSPRRPFRHFGYQFASWALDLTLRGSECTEPIPQVAKPASHQARLPDLVGWAECRQGVRPRPESQEVCAGHPRRRRGARRRTPNFLTLRTCHGGPGPSYSPLQVPVRPVGARPHAQVPTSSHELIPQVAFPATTEGNRGAARMSGLWWRRLVASHRWYDEPCRPTKTNPLTCPGRAPPLPRGPSLDR